MTNTLFVAWRAGDPNAARWGPVGRVDGGPGGYRFVYTEGARTLEGFHPFPSMPRLDAVYESDELFPMFANRLLSPSRPEYEAYLTWGGFDPNNPPDPLAILGVTEGIRQTDALEVFPCPAPDSEGRYLTKFFLHGIRWMPEAAKERISRLQPGEPLGLMLDISNQYDSFAVSVRTMEPEGRFMIGYVPRYFAHDVSLLCRTCHPDFIELSVERINPGAPVQHRVLCRVNACWPDGFLPCSGDDFQPIVDHPSLRCGPSGARA